MPYIKQDRRKKLQVEFHDTVASPDNAGDLNYVFTQVALRYLAEHGQSYQHINDCIGALEGCKLELYRRLAAPYEDTKIAENGDCY